MLRVTPRASCRAAQAPGGARGLFVFVNQFEELAVDPRAARRGGGRGARAVAAGLRDPRRAAARDRAATSLTCVAELLSPAASWRARCTSCRRSSADGAREAIVGPAQGEGRAVRRASSSWTALVAAVADSDGATHAIELPPGVHARRAVGRARRRDRRAQRLPARRDRRGACSRATRTA